MDGKVDDEVTVCGGYATGGVEEGDPNGNPDDENEEVVAVELDEFFLKENASVLRKLVESGRGLRTKGDEKEEGVVVFEGAGGLAVVVVVVVAVEVEGEEEGGVDEAVEDVDPGAVGVGAGVRKAVVVVVMVVLLLVEVVVVVGLFSRAKVVVGVEVGKLDMGGNCEDPSRRGLDGAESG